MLKRLFAIGLLGGVIWTAAYVTDLSVKAQAPERLTPILVELFTSEGCSSCPPADAFLETLDRLQPIHGAELIVLSEHVDYWNHNGWRDPYSSHLYSERQNFYAQRFGRDSVYTPQMVVDGSREFLGSDSRSADAVLAQALKVAKIDIRLSNIAIAGTRDLKVRVETDTLSPSLTHNGSDVYVAVLVSHVESNVSSGENSGHTLTHTGVVRRLLKIGNVQPGQSFAKNIQVTLDSSLKRENLRLVAFVQEARVGRVIGATMKPVSQYK